MNPQNITKTVIGIIAALAGLMVGFTCLITIGGLSMCAISVTMGMVVNYLTILIPIGMIFGYCFPKIWWLSPIFVAFAFMITIAELFHHEPERFEAMLALVVGLWASSFVGSRVAKYS